MRTIALILAIDLCGLPVFSNSGHLQPDRFEDAGNRIDSVTADTFDFFASDELLEMSLSFDLKKFLRSKNRPEYLKAAISIKDGDGTFPMEDSVKMKARGNMRRSYCQFPPVMLKFKNDDAGIPYSGRLKLVVPCMNSAKYENYVLKEFLVYRLFNLVSPYSLKSRLVKISLKDSKSESRSYTFLAFVIEDVKNLAQRNNAVVLSNKNLGQRNMEPDLMVRVALFNYMIGNTDWSVPMQHNIVLLKSNQAMTDKGIPVLYDFDYAGLVCPPYATPAEGLPIINVTERYYLGLCVHNDELDPAVSEFEGLKEEFMRTISDFTYLSDYDRKTTRSYMNSFFSMLRNKDSFVSTLSRNCK